MEFSIPPHVTTWPESVHAILVLPAAATPDIVEFGIDNPEGTLDWSNRLSPQAITAPSFLRAKLWFKPAEI